MSKSVLMDCNVAAVHRNFLHGLAGGIAATMRPGDKVVVIGDSHSGGLSIEASMPDVGEDYGSSREICIGVLRPELDEFADLVREAHQAHRLRNF